MKRTISALGVLILLAAAVAMLAPTDVMADPCTNPGNGIQHGFFYPHHCIKWCGEAPPGCSFWECSKCGCPYTCDDGTYGVMPSIQWPNPPVPYDPATSSGLAPGMTPSQGGWLSMFGLQPVRWPAPLK